MGDRAFSNLAGRAPGWITAAVVVCAAAAGCTAPRGPLVVTSSDPSVKIPAIKKAVRLKDRNAVKQLVTDLESDDPAVRFYAINGLRRITGHEFGYAYYATDEERAAAVRRWQQWLEGKDRGGAWATTTESNAAP
jgi:hypothetical protein